ncbi:hypothetical protein ACFQL1_10035 [Halomicroarcula sp. GCM10025709]|uniref:hypothetical protein n=1 Tax=Halomicroarcula sp. GCM10025709 TaxID=3252669 RepID=UPI00361E865A
MSGSPDHGVKLDGVALRCPNCQTGLGSDAGDASKSARLAALRALLITGVGHVSLGEIARGVGWFVGGSASPWWSR